MPSLPATPAFADRADQESKTPASTEKTASNPRERAENANSRAAEQAIEAVLDANRLDLDIKLIGPTSKKIVSDR